MKADHHARYELAHLGDAIGDPSRACILVALMGGVALPASELAATAGIARSTATEHLQRLVQAGLVTMRTQGRHRYFALAGPAVADALERLATLDRRSPPRRRGAADPLALARTCYGHWAGSLAIAFWQQARQRRWVRWSDEVVVLAPAGRDILVEHGLVSASGLVLRGRPCIDWTERVPHVSGRLGVLLCEGLLARGWLKRLRETRALRLTVRGEAGLASLGIRAAPGG